MSFEHRERLRLRAQEALANQIQADVVPAPSGPETDPKPEDIVPVNTPSAAVVTDEQVQATLQIVDALKTDDEYGSYMTELQQTNLPLFEQVNSILLERTGSVPLSQNQTPVESPPEGASESVIPAVTADVAPSIVPEVSNPAPVADVKPTEKKASRKAKNDVPATN